MEPEQLKAFGISKSRTRFITNPIRRLLFPFIRPYLHGILQQLSERGSRGRQLQHSETEALRKDLLAISSRLKSIELALGLESPAPRAKTKKTDISA